VLVSVNLAETDLPARRKFSLVGLVLLKAVPLTAALFLLFPRISGPLWGMPGDAVAGRTGLSSTMTPGAIGKLLESEAIAFRALFSGPVPLNDQRYWRGPVLSLFSGRTWSVRAPGPNAVALQLQADSQPQFEYTITQEPTQRDWLFALDLPIDTREAAALGARIQPDGQLIANRLITERVRYTITSATSFRYGLNETQLGLQEGCNCRRGSTRARSNWRRSCATPCPARWNRARPMPPWCRPCCSGFASRRTATPWSRRRLAAIRSTSSCSIRAPVSASTTPPRSWC
jgi:hypothetical protein